MCHNRAHNGGAADDVVFSAPGGGPLRLGNWRHRVFDPACAAAGLVGVTPHDLRHTAASLAIAAGANVKAVQRMLGHASAAMTLDIYAGLFGDDLDGVADALDDSCATNVPHRACGGLVVIPAVVAVAALTCGNVWWGVSGLNRRPTDYESAALTD